MGDGLFSGLVGAGQGRRADLRERGTQIALAVGESFPDAVCGGDAHAGAQASECVGLVAEAEHVLEEGPELEGAETAAPERHHDPDAEGMAAAAIAFPAAIAENPPATTDPQTIVRIGVAVEPAVEDQGADSFAERAERQVQSVMNLGQLLIGRVETRQRKTQCKPPKGKKRGV